MSSFLAFIGSLAIIQSFFSPTTVFDQTVGSYNVVIKNEFQTFEVNPASNGVVSVESAYSQDVVDIKKNDLNVSREFDKINKAEWKLGVNNLGFMIYSKNQLDMNLLYVDKTNNIKTEVKGFILESLTDGKILNIYSSTNNVIQKGRTLNGVNFTIVPFMKNPLFGKTNIVNGSGNTIFSNVPYNTSNLYTDSNGNIMFNGTGVTNETSLITLLSKNSGEKTEYNSVENGERFVMFGNLFKLFSTDSEQDFGIHIKAYNALFQKNSLYEIDNLGKNKLLLPSKSSIDTTNNYSCLGENTKSITCQLNGYARVYVGDLFNKNLYGIVGTKGTNYWTSESSQITGNNAETVDENTYIFYAKMLSDFSTVKYSADNSNNKFISEKDLVTTVLALLKSEYGNTTKIYVYAGSKYFFVIPNLGIAVSFDPSTYNANDKKLTVSKYSFDKMDNDQTLNQCYSSVGLQTSFKVELYCEVGYSLIENILTKSGSETLVSNTLNNENYFIVKRGFPYPKMLKPFQPFFSKDLSSGIDYDKLIREKSINEIEGSYSFSDILSFEGNNFVVNNIQQYEIFPTVSSNNVEYIYDKNNISDFSVKANSMDSTNLQMSYLPQSDGTSRLKYSATPNPFFDTRGNGVKIHINGIKGTSFKAIGFFENTIVTDSSKVVAENGGSDFTIPNNILMDNSAKNIVFKIVNSNNVIINEFSIYIKIKSTEQFSESAYYAGFLQNSDTENSTTTNPLFKNLRSEERHNYFRVSPFEVDSQSFGSAYSKFYKKIRVEITNRNTDQFYIEPVISHEGGLTKKGDIGISPIIIGSDGKASQTVFYELRNVRGFPNGSQNTFLIKMKPEAVKTSLSASYTLPITTNITYEYFEGDIPNFKVEKSGNNMNTSYKVVFDESGKKSISYIATEDSRLFVDLSKNNAQYSSLNLTHPCGYKYPVFNTRYSEDEFKDNGVGGGKDNDGCFSGDSIQGYGYFNMTLTMSKPKIEMVKYDNLRVRSMYDGDADGDGPLFGPGGGTRDYSWNKFPNTLYQYSTTLGKGAADFYDYNDFQSWNYGGYCGVFRKNEPNFDPIGHVREGERLSEDSSIGKPVVGVKELLFSVKIDSFYKRWLTKNPLQDSTPSMLSPIKSNFPIDFDNQAQTKILLGYTKNSNGSWINTNPNNYLKFPFMMAKDKDSGEVPSDVFRNNAGEAILSNWKSAFNSRGVFMGNYNGEIYFLGNSPYVKYDLNEDVMKQGVYKDGFELHLPSWLNGKIDRIYLTWNDEIKLGSDGQPEGIYYDPDTKKWIPRQGWYKKFEYLSIRMILNNANPAVVMGQPFQDRIKNSVEDMVKIVWPITSPGYVSVMTNTNAELNSSGTGNTFPTVSNVIDGVYVLKNALRDNGLLKFKTYFNAKQTYATNYRVGHMQHIDYYSGRNCRGLSTFHIPVFSNKYHVFKDGYYYNSDWDGRLNTTTTNGINIADPRQVNDPYEYVGVGSATKGLKYLMRQQDLSENNQGNSSFLSTSAGNYFIRFQTANQTTVFQGPRFASKDDKPSANFESSSINSGNDKGVIYLENEEYIKMKKLLFEGNADLKKPSVRDFFMNNSKITLVNSSKSMEDDIINSYSNDNLRDDEIKVFYYGTKNTSIQKDIKLLVCDGNEGITSPCSGKSPGTGYIGTKDFITNNGDFTYKAISSGSFKGLRVFITDGDVLLNGNLSFGTNISNNAYGPIIIATGKDRGTIYAGSRPDIFEGLLIANNLAVDYNYKMFMVNGGALIKNDITCDRYALQTAEVLSGNALTLNIDKREGYQYKLRNSCVIINNTKFSNFTLRKELGSGRDIK